MFKHTMFLIFILLSFYDCNTPRSPPGCCEKILGKWISVEETINYNTLIFYSNNYCVFTSRGDTLFRYAYKLEGCSSNLLLSDVYGNNYEYKIKLLSKDSLIFAKFFSSDEIKKYVRFSKK